MVISLLNLFIYLYMILPSILITEEKIQIKKNKRSWMTEKFSLTANLVIPALLIYKKYIR